VNDSAMVGRKLRRKNKARGKERLMKFVGSDHLLYLAELVFTRVGQA